MVSNVLVVVRSPIKSFIYKVNSEEMIEFETSLSKTAQQNHKKRGKKIQVRAHVRKRWPSVKVNIVLNCSVT